MMYHSLNIESLIVSETELVKVLSLSFLYTLGAPNTRSGLLPL